MQPKNVMEKLIIIGMYEFDNALTFGGLNG